MTPPEERDEETRGDLSLDVLVARLDELSDLLSGTRELYSQETTERAILRSEMESVSSRVDSLHRMVAPDDGQGLIVEMALLKQRVDAIEADDAKDDASRLPMLSIIVAIVLGAGGLIITMIQMLM